MIFISTVKVYAVDYNWAADADSVKTSGGSSSGDTGGNNWPRNGGTTEDIFDNNNVTYRYYGHQSKTRHCTCELWGQSDFKDPQYINKIVSTAIISQYCNALYTFSYTISAYYAGGWHTIGNNSWVNQHPVPGGSVDVSATFDNLNLSGVTSVKTYFYGRVSSNTPFNYVDIQINSYELQAWGPLPTGYNSFIID